MDRLVSGVDVICVVKGSCQISCRIDPTALQNAASGS